jgi:quercetin dioxygenase-like cupin family protein
MSCAEWPAVVDHRAYGVRFSLYVLEPGGVIPRHAHRWGHKLFIADGAVRFTKELHQREVEAPALLSVEPQLEHEVVAIRRSVVLSIFGEEGSV